MIGRYVGLVIVVFSLDIHGSCNRTISVLRSLAISRIECMTVVALAQLWEIIEMNVCGGSTATGGGAR